MERVNEVVSSSHILSCGVLVIMEKEMKVVRSRSEDRQQASPPCFIAVCETSFKIDF